MTGVLTEEKSTGTRFSLPVFRGDFVADAHEASTDRRLQAAMDNSVTKRDMGRKATLAELPDAAGLRELAGQIKRHTLDHLDYYLEMLEISVKNHGGQVHYASDSRQANQIIIDIAKKAGCKLAVKSKSMVSEETELNDALAKAGVEPLETDLGEFILQVDHDHPTHLVMPVVHKNAADIGHIFERYFKTEFTDNAQVLAEMARVHLRNRFNEADLGISGVNFAVAETGSIVVCCNEGNGRMCVSRPRVHVALMGMEKIIPSLDDLPVFLKLLARSASGQSLTQYTSIVSGSRRQGELDGPEEFHLVIMDNGRSRILAGEYRDTLRCIRCGACLNSCPIYRKVGGRTYGSVYPGPIGALLTPLFNGLEQHKHLPHASSLCGACFDACPVKINIPEFLIKLRGDQVKQRITPWTERVIFKLYTIGLQFGWTYRLSQFAQRIGLRLLKDKQGWIRRLPPPVHGWTLQRDFPAPAKEDFRTVYKRYRQEQQSSQPSPAEQKRS